MAERARMRRGAVIVAGGRGARLGGVDKASLRIDGERLVDRALAAVAGADERVVVGEVAGVVGARVVVEAPRFGGPALALAAGVAALSPAVEVVDVLAVDLRDHAGVVAALEVWPIAPPADGAGHTPQTERTEPAPQTDRTEPAPPTANAGHAPPADGAILVADGRPQWLAARILAAPLRRTLAGARPDDSLRRILGPLALDAIAAPPELARDIDTLSDIAEAGVEPPPVPQEGAAP